MTTTKDSDLAISKNISFSTLGLRQFERVGHTATSHTLSIGDTPEGHTANFPSPVLCILPPSPPS